MLSAAGIPLPWVQENKNNEEIPPEKQIICTETAPLLWAQLLSALLSLGCALPRAGKGWAAVGQGQGQGQRRTVGPGNFSEEDREQNYALVV